MRTIMATAVLAGAFALGCQGTTTTLRTTSDASAIEYEVYPTEIIVVKPGESRDVKVTRKGQGLKDTNLTVTSSDPKVTVEGGQFKGDSKEATVTIKTSPDTPENEHAITIKSNGTTKTVRLRVEKAGRTDKKQ